MTGNVSPLLVKYKVTATIGLVAFHDIVKAEKTTSTSQPTPDKSETKS
jgi:hypothetical protein